MTILFLLSQLTPTHRPIMVIVFFLSLLFGIPRLIGINRILQPSNQSLSAFDRIHAIHCHLTSAPKSLPLHHALMYES